MSLNQLRNFAYDLFCTDEDYRKIIEIVIGNRVSRNELKLLEDHLYKIGYSENVIVGEMSAYLITEKEYLINNNVWNDNTTHFNSFLTIIFNHYSNKNKTPT